MEQIVENNFGKAFAIAWSENQGGYSENLAKKTLNFIKLQGLKVSSALDICCGSANYLNVLHENGIKCSGTETLSSYIEYNSSKFKNMEFYKTNDVDDIDNLGTYDLISCNHDVINMLPTLERWKSFFEKVYKHLNNGGIFIFDYYTKRKLKEWNETLYEENEKMDYLKNISSDGQTKTAITSIYYINLVKNVSKNDVSVMDREYQMNNYDKKYKKAEDVMVEYFFENEDILNAIKNSGYRYLITTDANFSPISGIENVNRMHVIAIKREV